MLSYRGSQSHGRYHEARIEGLEESRSTTLEMEKEKVAQKETCQKTGKAIVLLQYLKHIGCF